jgi:hypothetical protein
MMTAAAPSPAPSPAASPVLLDPLFPSLLLPTESAPLPLALTAAGDPVSDALGVTLSPRRVSVCVAVSVATVVTPFNGCSVKPAVVGALPGQVVLPITVTVVGCSAPSMTAKLPLSQLHLSSPGQQYQSFSPGHLTRGMDVSASVERSVSDRDFRGLCVWTLKTEIA